MDFISGKAGGTGDGRALLRREEAYLRRRPAVYHWYPELGKPPVPKKRVNPNLGNKIVW